MEDKLWDYKIIQGMEPCYGNGPSAFRQIAGRKFDEAFDIANMFAPVHLSRSSRSPYKRGYSVSYAMFHALEPRSLKLLMWLSASCNAFGYCAHNNKQLAVATRLTERAITKCLQVLADGEYIKIDKAGTCTRVIMVCEVGCV